MKSLIAIIMFTLFMPQAFASKKQTTSVGVQVILRQVFEQQLLGKDGLKAVQVALAGTGNSSLDVTIENADCEAALGSYVCNIWLNQIDQSRPDGFKDISFGVQVHIYQGTIKTARPYCTKNDPSLNCER